MKVLLVGSGGREHAIAKSIFRSNRNLELYAVMNHKNPGIAPLCKEYLITNETDPELVEYALGKGVELAVIGPETPLAAGIPDLLWEADIPVVGPRRDAARIEFDKTWMRKNILDKYGIPGNPEYRIFRKSEDNACGVDIYLEELRDKNKDPVIKPAGLTGGKGVRLVPEHFNFDGARDYAVEVLKNSDLVIEERLIGQEFTVQAFVDGENLAYAPAIQDEKRAYPGGPNTGGMGSYNDADDLLPFMRQSDYDDAKKIMSDTVQSIKKETGVPFQGILYGQFMATGKGISVIEFNARGGDSELINALYLLDNDFLDVCSHILNGTLGKANVTFKKLATVFKYAVPEGYPGEAAVDSPIGIGDIGNSEIRYANVYEKDGVLNTMKSRALGFLGAGATIYEAENAAEKGLSAAKGRIYGRHDLATPPLIKEKILQMEKLRAR